MNPTPASQPDSRTGIKPGAESVSVIHYNAAAGAVAALAFSVQSFTPDLFHAYFVPVPPLPN